jgi:hypothetical protein
LRFWRLQSQREKFYKLGAAQTSRQSAVAASSGPTNG